VEDVECHGPDGSEHDQNHGENYLRNNFKLWVVCWARRPDEAVLAVLILGCALEQHYGELAGPELSAHFHWFCRRGFWHDGWAGLGPVAGLCPS